MKNLSKLLLAVIAILFVGCACNSQEKSCSKTEASCSSSKKACKDVCHDDSKEIHKIKN